MILVDTTVWIDFFKGVDTRQVGVLETSIQNNTTICICGVIVTEILQGIRDEKNFERTKGYLQPFFELTMDYPVFIKAAQIYRTLRKKGVTIRKPIDCMIAAVSLEYDVPLLHQDKDFDLIEKHLDLRVIHSE